MLRAASPHALLRLGACSLGCTVLVDGAVLAERGNGYGAFDVVLPPPEGGAPDGAYLAVFATVQCFK